MFVQGCFRIAASGGLDMPCEPLRLQLQSLKESLADERATIADPSTPYQQRHVAVLAVKKLETQIKQASEALARCLSTGSPPVREGVRGLPLAGVHAYAQKWVSTEGRIELKVSSDVDYKLSLFRLGSDPNSPSQDQLVTDLGDFPASTQAIHPGSFLEVFPGLPNSKTIPAITLEMWIRVYEIQSPANAERPWRGLMTQHSFPSACGIGMFLSPDNELVFYGGNGPTYDLSRQVKSSISITPNVWLHVAAVFDGARSTVDFRVTRADTGAVVTRSVASSGMSGVLPAAVQFRVGAYGAYGHTNQFLDADIAMPAVHLRALSSNELAGRAVSALSVATGTGLWACWPLSEGCGDLAHDVSGGEHHATVVNGPTWRVSGPKDPALQPGSSRDDLSLMRPGRPAALRLASDDLPDCGWNTTHSIDLPASEPSGLYVARFLYSTNQIYDVTVVVSPKVSGPGSRLAVIANSSTWLAYNSKPFAVTDNSSAGAVLYGTEGPAQAVVLQGPQYSCYSRHAAGQPGTVFGTRRPWPSARPYIYYSTLTDIGNESTGSLPSSSASLVNQHYSHLLRAERFTHVWLEANGYAFDVIPDLLVDDRPDVLESYQAVIVCGHSEYWSDRMFDGVRNYLNHGGNLIALSGNTLNWRVSHDHATGLMECRKASPLNEEVASLVRWEDSIHQLDGEPGGVPRAHGRSVRDVMGLDYAGVLDADVLSPFHLTGSQHPILSGPHAIDQSEGSQFGTASVGHETDTLFAAVPAGMTMLASSPNVLPSHQLNFEGSRWDADNALGVAAIVMWDRPRGGRVFNVGSLAAGLALHVEDPTSSAPQARLSRLLLNVLHSFGL